MNYHILLLEQVNYDRIARLQQEAMLARLVQQARMTPNTGGVMSHSGTKRGSQGRFWYGVRTLWYSNIIAAAAALAGRA